MLYSRSLLIIYFIYSNVYMLISSSLFINFEFLHAMDCKYTQYKISAIGFESFISLKIFIICAEHYFRNLTQLNIYY